VNYPHRLRVLVRDRAIHYGLDPDLAEAIATVESGLKPWVVRYEAHYRWLWHVPDMAHKLGITTDTERALQSMSYGPMQIMGAVCRELGYLGHLTSLPGQDELTIDYACQHLKSLARRFGNEPSDLAAAYNAGSPRKEKTGMYGNQQYVDKVHRAMREIQARL